MDNIYDFIFLQNGGIVNLGRSLGLFYAPKAEMKNCPMGWVFVAVEDTPNARHIEKIANEYKKEVLG